MTHVQTRTAPAQVPPSPRRGSWLLRVGVVLACLLGLVLGGMLLSAGMRGQPPPDAPLPAAPFTAAQAPHGSGKQAARAVGRTSFRPNRLIIDTLGIDAPVRPESVAASGELVVPGNVGTVGRWADGPPVVASVGTTLLAGHVDYAGRLGALHSLYRITPNTLVILTDGRGAPTYWRVVSLQARRKADLPTFARTGPRRLALVTCGGAVIDTGSGRGYADNVIAIAVPWN